MLLQGLSAAELLKALESYNEEGEASASKQRMYSNEVKGAPQKPDLLLRSYMVGRVLLRPSPPTIKHIYTDQIKKSVQPTGYDA